MYHSTNGDLEYDYLIYPGADPGRIKFTLPASSLINRDGSLTVGNLVPEIRLLKPLAYQLDGAKHLPVACSFSRASDGAIGFRLGSFDRSKTLIIDPVVSFSVVFGGSSGDTAAYTSVDQWGNAYVVGTSQLGFPVTMGAVAHSSVFITKFDPNGALLYSNYFGGSGPISATSGAIDMTGNLYVVGTTSSSNYPSTAGAAVRSITCGAFSVLGTDGFSVKFSPSGAVVYSTLLGQCSLNLGGGSQVTSVNAVVDAIGDIFAAVNVFSPKGVTAGAVVVKVNVAGSSVTQILPSGFLQIFPAIGIDPGGFLYLATTDFSLTTNRNKVTKLSPAGSTIYSTSIGLGIPSAMTVDALGQAYITGQSQNGTQPTPGSYQNGTTGSFVTKLAASGTVLYTSVIGSAQTHAIAADSLGNCYVAGSASSSLAITNGSATQPNYGGGMSDGFLFELNPEGTAPVFATFIGGIQSDNVNSMAVTPSGSIYLAGNTISNDFPSTSATSAKGGGDVFILKLTSGSISVPTAPLLFSLAAGSQPVTKFVQISGSLASLGFSVSVSPNTGWLSVSPPSGLTPVALSVMANPGGLPAGIYGGTVTVSGTGGATGSINIPVSLAVSAPFPTISGVFNAASFQGGAISPGEIVTISGTALGPNAPANLSLDKNGNVSTSLGGVQVMFNGKRLSNPGQA